MNLFNLNGLTAVISGGSGWLGSPIVRALSSAGAQVTVVGRDINRIKAEFSDCQDSVHAVRADVLDDSWPEAIAKLGHQMGRIDIVINNAHIGRGGSLQTAGATDYLQALELSVIAAAKAIEAARPWMGIASKSGGSPSIINMASMYGQVAPDPKIYAEEASCNPPYYGAAKAALIQLTKYAAAELGPEGIRVNAISPGPFPNHNAQADTGFAARLAERTMLGRIGNPFEIASTALYLASPASSFTTGAVIPVDGGWTAW